MEEEEEERSSLMRFGPLTVVDYQPWFDHTVREAGQWPEGSIKSQTLHTSHHQNLQEEKVWNLLALYCTTMYLHAAA